MNPKIVVIGAGLAGLTTGYRLKQIGFNVEVYEARKRLGGRVLTIKIGKDSVELGGQNIRDGGEAENILSLIAELGLEILTTNVPFHFHELINNKIIDTNVLLKKYHFTPDAVKEKLHEISQSSSNLKDVIRAIFKDDEILYNSFCMRIAAYEGLPPEYLSLINLPTLYYMLLGGLSSTHQSQGSDEVYIHHQLVKGGNSRLIEALGRKLKDCLFLNCPLSSIDMHLNKYLLTFSTGIETTADIVVLAIPCSVYSDISIHPSVIPYKKLSAIQAVKYGTNSKILVPIHHSYPTGLYSNGRMFSYFPCTFEAVGMYYIGDHSRFTASSIGETFQADFSSIQSIYQFSSMPPPTMAIDEAFIQYSVPVGYSWPNDPYAKGSYSCIATGQERLAHFQESHGEIVKSLFAPINQTLFFAGEHTTSYLESGGTMEAAVESGERTARLIRKILEPAHPHHIST